MSNLTPFLRTGLDVLFVALNAPAQSDSNRHWFSGSGSRFFALLARSSLISAELPKHTADDIVFGSVASNYRHASFGVVDLVPDVVETMSARVKPRSHHVEVLVDAIRCHSPRFVCVLHSKVRKALNRYGGLTRQLEYGANGRALAGCRTEFFVNFFPNGNNIEDGRKIAIFSSLRERL